MKYSTEINLAMIYATKFAFVMVEVLAIIFVGYFLGKWLRNQLRRVLKKVKHIDETLTLFLPATLHYLIIILAAIACLSKLGIETTSIIAVLGTAGLAIGLSLQGTLSNIASGIIILLLRPFKVGEFIETGDTTGTVKVIGLFATELQTSDGLFIMTPNSQLWSRAVKNYSRNPNRRVEILIGISYNSDIAKAKEVINKVIDSDTEIQREPLPDILVEQLADSSVNLKIRFWIDRTIFFPKKSELTEMLKGELEANGISIPFPQREIKIVNQTA